jgi:hypothetical protein
MDGSGFWTINKNKLTEAVFEKPQGYIHREYASTIFS